jgi:hypothetical protein
MGNTDVFCFLDFREDLHPGIPCPESIGQAQYVKDVFIDSETDVGVISGLPAALPLGPSAMAETRDLVNQLAGSERALSQAVCDPTAPAGAETHIDTMEMQVKVLKGRALKCYTYSYGGWRLDDDNGTRMLEEATRLGIKLVNTHKGLPAIFAPGSPETVRTTDYPGALRNFPKMKFMAYHSGYFQGDTHPEGKGGITEWIEMLESLPKKDRRRMYSEIGSTFAIVWLSGPDNAAHFIGQLLKTLGSRNVIWGTDSVWWGSPQWLIDAFKALEIPESMQEQFGYPALTEKVKRRILGENAAKLYGVKRNEERCTVPPDSLQQIQIARGGHRAGRNLGGTDRKRAAASCRCSAAVGRGSGQTIPARHVAAGRRGCARGRDDVCRRRPVRRALCRARARARRARPGDAPSRSDDRRPRSACGAGRARPSRARTLADRRAVGRVSGARLPGTRERRLFAAPRAREGGRRTNRFVAIARRAATRSSIGPRRDMRRRQPRRRRRLRLACGRCAAPAAFTSSFDAIRRTSSTARTTCHGAALTAGLDLRAPAPGAHRRRRSAGHGRAPARRARRSGGELRLAEDREGDAR